MAYTRQPNVVLAGQALIQNPTPIATSPAGILPVTLDAAIASTSQLGVIKVGSGLAITPAGILSTTGSSPSYSFGSWTPSLIPSSGTICILVTQAKYTKIGQLVTCTYNFTVTAIIGGSSSNTVKLGGLPFASLSDDSYVGGVVVSKFVDMDNNVDSISGSVNSNSTTADMWITKTQQTSVNTLQHGDLKVNSRLSGTITYFSAV